jgi:3-methyladenine DNA glycosylase/8-oxoguanine DNA glycosylase
MPLAPDAAVTFRPWWPVDLGRTLGPMARWPAMRVGGDGVWRATLTPDGPATSHLRVDGDGVVHMRAWGPGASWAAHGLPTLVGADDDVSGFAAVAGTHPLVRDLCRRMPGLRVPRTRQVFEALAPTIIEQKVQGHEARRSYARLVRRLGQPAPGPGRALGLFVPPAPDAWAATPSWVFHRAGIERRRADTVRVAASYARRLDEAAALSIPEARARLTALPGIGQWTAAEVAWIALGDADAVSVGDYHIPNTVAWALAGEARADDARMLELLEPFRPHRGRVIRLIEAAGIGAPRFGPRMPLNSIAGL